MHILKGRVFLAKGIDVSKWQGVIDWEKAKKGGVGFAILRLGFTGTASRKPALDGQFRRNLAQCKRHGIDAGVYYYSTATTERQAKAEARFIIKQLKGEKLQYPVYIDTEDVLQANLSKSKLTAVVKAFCDEMEKAGYYVGIYANKNWFAEQLNDGKLKAYDKWVAQYNDKCTYSGAYGMWQYTDKGKIAGINGFVDLNKCYKDYPKIIKKAKLNGYK